MVEATPELDALFPVGTVMPSVITEAPFEGDRGDVTAVAEWRDGWWRMGVKRTLAAASDYAVSIGDGSYLWVSVFDPTQTRHSFHLRPLQIRLHILSSREKNRCRRSTFASALSPSTPP